MAFLVNTAKTLRNHWKKSTFGVILVTYGVHYSKNYLETQELLRVYCQKAAKYGKEPIPVNVSPRNITVILNPNANKRKASDEFEKYCAPLLHLAGICIEVIKTESEGHAKSLIETVSTTEAIVVAGGDGTLSEVVTGLLRRTDENTNGLVPIGILPLGKENSVAFSLFPGGQKVEKIRSLVDATMAVIEEVTKPMDVMKIEVLQTEEVNNKPVYALGGIKWGAYRDAEVKKDSYWYFGGLRKYATYIFNGCKSSLTWNCEASVNYSPPCEGCSNCFQRKMDNHRKKWYHKFVKEDSHSRTLSQLKNPECEEIRTTKISTADLSLLTSNIIPTALVNSPTIPKLQINIGPENVGYLDFVREGWRSENGENRRVEKVLEARTVEIQPAICSTEKHETWFSIDNENYEVKPVRITLLPKMISMFCKRENNVVHV